MVKLFLWFNSLKIENNSLLDLKYAYKTHFLTNIFIFVQVGDERIKIKFPGGSCTEFTAQTPTGQIYASFIWLSYKCQDFRIDPDSLQRPRTG